MKKTLFSIISIALQIIVILGFFFPYISKVDMNLWRLFGNAFAISGITFSVIGILGSIFKKNDLNYLACGFYIGIHIYLFNVLHVDKSFELEFSMLSLGFYLQAAGVILLLMATFISSFFKTKEKKVNEKKRNNTEVKTTVNNGQLNVPVNNFKSLPVDKKEEEKTMPKPDLLKGVKQNDDSLFVNSNLFVNTSEPADSTMAGPNLFDHISIPISNNNVSGMPAQMMAPPEANNMPGPAMPAPEINSMPAQMMAPPEVNNMPGPAMPAPEMNSMPAQMMAPPEVNNMPGQVMPASEINSMPAQMMAPPEANNMPGPTMPAPEMNSMPASMMTPPEVNNMPVPAMPAPEMNSMPASMMAIPEAPVQSVPVPEQNAAPSLGGILGGLPAPSQEGGTDIKSIMNEGPSVEEQLEKFNAAHANQNPDVPKPDLLAGSNLSGILGNGDPNGENTINNFM